MAGPSARSSSRRMPLRSATPAAKPAAKRAAQSAASPSSESATVVDNTTGPSDAYGAASKTQHLAFQPTPPIKDGQSTEQFASARNEPGEIDLLGETVKECISVINKLSALGLSTLNIKLPKCVVLGEQSAGKSSVIEAISGIRTPRSTSTCTRCPLFIMMEPSSCPDTDWNARVSLRKAYSKEARRSARGRYPGWSQRPVAIELPFDATTSKEHLEDVILRAQYAVLSDSDDLNSFTRSDIQALEAARSNEFSPNTIAIAITAPGLPSLSFYDLPGIIGQSEDHHSQYLVPFVKHVVEDYIRDQDALILVTHSLANDLHTSIAGMMARENKATNRCIGVLTKPDCLPAGDKGSTLAGVLRGSSFQLGHGYFIVKNLSQIDIDHGLTHSDARRQEDIFFGTPPWSTLHIQYQDRFGTRNLQTYLSTTLAAHTVKALPYIRSEIHERLELVRQELEQIPEPPSHNAIHVVSAIVRDFARNIEFELDGEYGHNKWLNTWKAARQHFADCLINLKPGLITGGKADEMFWVRRASETDTDVIVIEDDDDDNDDATTARASSVLDTPKRRKMNDGTPTPTLTPKSSTMVGGPSTPSSIKLKERLKAPVPLFTEKAVRFTLDGIKAHMEEHSNSNFPDQLHPKVKESMIQQTMKDWALPLNSFLDKFKTDLVGHMLSIFKRHFGKWRNSGLYDAAWKVVEDMLVGHMEALQFDASEALSQECDGPYIFFDDNFQRERQYFRQRYANARFERRKNMYLKALKAKNPGRAVDENVELKRDNGSLRTLIAQEPYSKELEFVADVSSYYNVASHRLHDTVCMRVKYKVFKALRNELLGELESTLDIHGDDGQGTCVRLLAEPNHRLADRQRLMSQRQALLDGQEILDDLEAKYGNVNGIGMQQESDEEMCTPPTDDEMDVEI